MVNIDGDIISKIQVGWLKWRNASGLLCDRKVPLKHKGKFYKMVSEKTTQKIPPCSTLFIANLGPNCSEAELNKVLSKFSGFLTLKMRAKWGMPVAFADFENVESSTAAMESLEGTLIDSSDRGGMHIEYARSKMRRN